MEELVIESDLKRHTIDYVFRIERKADARCAIIISRVIDPPNPLSAGERSYRLHHTDMTHRIRRDVDHMEKRSTELFLCV
jgi:hypothetical protein